MLRQNWVFVAHTKESEERNMETVYYNFYSFENAKASGGEDHRAILVRDCAPQRRAAGGNKVISLEDYRARQSALSTEGQRSEDLWEESEEDLLAEPAGHTRTAAPRASRWNRLLATLELAACGAMIAVAAVACVVFL